MQRLIDPDGKPNLQGSRMNQSKTRACQIIMFGFAHLKTCLLSYPEAMKVFVVLLFGLGIAFAALSRVTPGLNFANPGDTALVRLEFQQAQDLWLNLRADSVITLENPFGKKPIEVVLQKGKPAAKDPEHYLESIDPLEVKIPIPKTAKAGDYTLKLEAQVFVCDGKSELCFIQNLEGTTVLKVGTTGKNQAVLVSLEKPKR